MTKKQEAQSLSNKIIEELEQNKGELQEQLFKTMRVCRLIDDELGMKIFRFETCGYTREANGQLTKASWEVIGLVGRVYFEKVQDKTNKYAETRLVSELINENKILEERMKVAADPQSYGDNMTPFMINTAKNENERQFITTRINHNSNFINTIKGFLYNYMLNIYNALCYGAASQTIFENIRSNVDSKIAEFCPENTKKFLSVYENLMSTNDEDWANAINTCRRVMIELANKIYPAKDEPVVKDGKTIQLKESNYINRLIQYIESKSDSKTYRSIIGTEIDYIGNVLDSLINGFNKGTHNLYTKYQAERVVVYTYMLIGDILNL